ncbi:MAG: prepilin-type N-terminal cleavage/methylation domain-containing protein [Deltaproteobacteria bacterium]|nr:prepilin-type N-terminal cleavage/methylation domain-containing protein [Deltaproteobacteria bacterium]
MRAEKLKQLKSNAGMTLLELLIAMAVIGSLAAISIQEFNNHRRRAIDSSMRGELRNAAMAMESYYGENLEYPASLSSILLVGYRNTASVTLTITVTSPSSYNLNAARAAGTQASFTFDSATGLIN